MIDCAIIEQTEEITKLNDFLFLGGCYNPHGPKTLPSDITHVFNFSDWDYLPPDHIHYYRWLFHDTIHKEPDAEKLAKAVNAVADIIINNDDEKNHRVLVHCTQGWNRSALVLGLALCLAAKEQEIDMSPQEIVWFLQKRSPDVLSNKLFRNIILNFERNGFNLGG